MENLLPVDITLEILSRLPTESVIQCRRVCKTWRILLQHPSFAHMHLHRLLHLDDHKSNNSNVVAAKVGLGLLFKIWFRGERGSQIHYVEYDELSYKTLKRINQPPINHHTVVGSCNGLICFSVIELSSLNEPVYICNPITGEYVNLPKVNINNENMVGRRTGCGFGYLPNINVYKVVRIYYNLNQPLGWVQVYTLGSGSGWRDKGECTYSLRRGSVCDWYHVSHGIFANGSVHWLDREEKIVAFDLVDEEFHLVPSPPFVRTRGVCNYFQLRVLGGCLCLVHQKRDESDIWLLKKKKESSCYDMNEQEYDSWSWSKEFTIAIEGNQSTVKPIALTNTGEVLLWYNSAMLSRYDPKTATLENLVNDDTSFMVSEAIPHMNSFVSLKALGERCKLRKRYYHKLTVKAISIKQQMKEKEEIDA